MKTLARDDQLKYIDVGGVRVVTDNSCVRDGWSKIWRIWKREAQATTFVKEDLCRRRVLPFDPPSKVYPAESADEMRARHPVAILWPGTATSRDSKLCREGLRLWPRGQIFVRSPCTPSAHDFDMFSTSRRADSWSQRRSGSRFARCGRHPQFWPSASTPSFLGGHSRPFGKRTIRLAPSRWSGPSVGFQRNFSWSPKLTP